MDKVYLALYSFGMDSTLSLSEKIKTAAEIGYSGVEFAGGYDDLTAAEIKAIVEAAGVDPFSSHVQLDNIEAELPFLQEIGVKYAICPMHSFTNREEALELAETLNSLGKKAAAYGIKVGFHNHTQEFWKVDDEYLLEILLNNTDPNYVIFQLDCGWASAAGIDPVAFINKYAGRFAAIHVKENAAVIGVDEPKPRPKDGKRRPPFEMKFDEDGKPIIPPEFLRMMEERAKINVPTGQGIVDWSAVKEAADAQGCKAYIVEREYSYNTPQDRVACLKEDFEYLKNNV